MAKPNRMKVWRGWAMVGPDNHIVTICKCPSIYGTKRDVLLDKEDGDRAVRVEVREVRSTSTRNDR